LLDSSLEFYDEKIHSQICYSSQ